MSRHALAILRLLAVTLLIGRAANHARSQGVAAGAAILMHEVVPQPSREPLVNPGMGLYLYGTLDPADMPPNAWFSKLLNIGYFRDDWSKLEPDAEGRYRFAEYFDPIFDLWVKRWHKRVAFRFMASNMHSQQKYVTPKWVFDKGVPGVTHKGIYVPNQIDPVFWDERYLAIQERFIADLGHYLDGRPGLEFIDIGAIGEWGEMHLSRWTSEQLEQAGFTPARYIAAYRRVIDAFARAFPHTRVFLNVGDYAAINDYAAIRGLHFRQDGLTPSGPSNNVGKRFYWPYAQRGVICNYELYADYTEMKQKGWGVPETFAKGLEDPVSYFHINLMSYHDLLDPPTEVKTAIMDAARRIGFRFALTHLRCSKTLKVRKSAQSRLLIEATWKNEGVAPCYDSYALRWSLLDAAGHVAAETRVFPSHPTTQWEPGKELTLTDVLTVPAGLPPGRYMLKVAMERPETGEQIQLALADRGAEGRYAVCPITAEAGSETPTVAYAEGFESGSSGWTASEGIEARTGPAAHTGNGCLLVQGTQPGNSWNYAFIHLKAPVLPASRYRLSCWMRVDRIDPGANAPYLKIGLNDRQSRWLTNVETNHYDTAKQGTWQHLQALVETPTDTGGGDLAIEKGSLEAHLGVTLRLDDVKLELLESP